jgi:hypothetical protein
MSRPKANFIIDAAMLLCGSALSGIGFLMKFVLIPGKERFAVYGRNVDLFFLGLDRHEWGTVHLLIAFILFALLVAHILLHLRFILNMTSGIIAGQQIRKIAAALFLLLCLLCGLFAFVVQPEVREGGGGEGRGGFGKGRMEYRLRN